MFGSFIFSHYLCINKKKKEKVMKAKELAEVLMEHPDFEVELKCDDFEIGCIRIDDIRYSGMVIMLGGEIYED